MGKRISRVHSKAVKAQRQIIKNRLAQNKKVLAQL